MANSFRRRATVLTAIATVCCALLFPSELSATKILFKGKYLSNYPQLTKKDIGETIKVPDNFKKGLKWEVELEPGIYRYEEFSFKTGVARAGAFDLQIKSPEEYGIGADDTYTIQIRDVQSTFSMVDKNFPDSYVYQYGVDYKLVDFYHVAQDGFPRNTDYTPAQVIQFMAVEGDSFRVEEAPSEEHPGCCSAIHQGVVGTSNSKTEWLQAGKSFSFSYPEEAEGFFGTRSGGYYTPLKELAPQKTTVKNGMVTNTYFLPMRDRSFDYRVSMPGCLTRAMCFDVSTTDEVIITKEEMESMTRYFNHPSGGGNGLQYADIYLNINRAHHMYLEPGKKFHINNLRTWQIVTDVISNTLIEPDYHYTVLNESFEPDNSVVTIDDKGNLTALATGTAIVQVRYDGIEAKGMYGGDLWSEIWAENTGTFVITVCDSREEAEQKAPKTNIHLEYKPTDPVDAEHDIMYYPAELEGYALTFKPSDGSTVTVANPLVDSENNTVSYPLGFSARRVKTNPDGSVTATLTFGRNIIRVADAQGNKSFQVLTGKPVTTKARTKRNDGIFLPGDSVGVVVDGVYHVAGKLAGIYNSSCYILYNDIPNGNANLGSGQYNFAGNDASRTYPAVIPTDCTDSYTLIHGSLMTKGFGSAPGAHRAISDLNNVNPNFNAPVTSAYYASLPDVTIPVTPYKSGMKLSAKMDKGTRLYPLAPSTIRTVLGESVTWSSSDESVATVDDNGCVLATGYGTAIVTVSATETGQPSGITSIPVEITVERVPVTGISLRDKVEMTIYPNLSSIENSLYLTVYPDNATDKSVTYNISNPEIVTIDNNGYLNAIAPGTATITVVTTDGNFSGDCLVTVNRAPDDLEIEASASVSVGGTFSLTPIITPEETTLRKVIFNSLHPAIADVDENGVITGIAPGQAIIQARVKDGYRITPDIKTCLVTVENNESAIGEPEVRSLLVYPNPVALTLYVNVDRASDLTIYNLNGLAVLRHRLEEGSNSIDVSRLSAGLYLVSVDGKTLRIIKK